MTGRKTLNVLVAVLAVGLPAIAHGQEGFWSDVEQVGHPDINGIGINLWQDISADGLELYFTSFRGGQGSNLYVATRTASDGPFEAVRSLDEINAAENGDRRPDLAADGQTLYFDSGRGGNGSDLWLSLRDSKTNRFGPPENLGPGVNTEFAEWGPKTSEDGLELYFSSDRPGGQGEDDLYLATRENLDAPFDNVRNLTALNTATSEGTPGLSADGLTLFFSRTLDSNTTEILMATREQTSDDFANPIVFGRPVNRPRAFNFSPSLSATWPADGATLYFSRCFGQSECDVYQAIWHSLDDCRIADNSTFLDCNENGLSDACEIEKLADTDLNDNDIPDGCEPDCNTNRIPDEVDIASATSTDCNENSIPDDCEADENLNEIADECESRFIRGDCDGDGDFILTDGLHLLRFLFLGTEAPGCKAACDPFASGFLGVTTAVGFFEYLFLGGPPPVAPFPDCGLPNGELDLLLGCESTSAICR